MHILVHKFRCGHCEFASNSAFHLEIHFKNVHKNLNVVIEKESLPPICEEGMCHKCDRQFSSKYYLINKHLPKCNGVGDSLVCEVCFKRFSNRYIKYQHKKVCEVRIAKKMDEIESRMLRKAAS
jgi:RecJ-like exonuclease